MSYDIDIGRASFNYTSNVSQFFYDHIEDCGSGGGLRELDGKTGKQCVAVLTDAFKRISTTRRELYVDGTAGEPAMCAKYDAPNGWGSMVGAMCLLSEILGECAQHPRAVARVSS